jgi:hypothetical protein
LATFRRKERVVGQERECGLEKAAMHRLIEWGSFWTENKCRLAWSRSVWLVDGAIANPTHLLNSSILLPGYRLATRK